MDFSKWLIASDIDGTYLDKNSQFVPRNLEALERFRAGGGLFTFSSGRNAGHMGKNVGDPATVCNAPAVLCNGTCIYDFRTGEIVSEHLLTPEEAADVLRFCTEKMPAGVQYRAMARGGVYTPFHTGMVGRDLQSCVPETVHVGPPETFRMDDWYKMVFRADAAGIAAVRAALAETFGDRFLVTASTPHIAELQKKGCTKATGVAELRRLCGEGRTVVCCGDYENDMEMLAAADIAVCPANASDEVKAIADMVLCDCSTGLIADIIEHIEAGTLRKKQH